MPLMEKSTSFICCSKNCNNAPPKTKVKTLEFMRIIYCMHAICTYETLLWTASANRPKTKPNEFVIFSLIRCLSASFIPLLHILRYNVQMHFKVSKLMRLWVFGVWQVLDVFWIIIIIITIMNSASECWLNIVCFAL